MSMNAKLTRFYRGDIVINESNGKRNYAVIVSNNTVNFESPSVNIVNITANIKDNVRYTAEIALSVPSYAICDRPWNVWKENIVEFVRECTAEEMAAIDKGLRSAFGLDEPKKKYEITHVAEAPEKGAQDALRERIAELEKENEQLRLEISSANENVATFAEIAEDVEKSETCITALTAERDTYKAMYEKLLDKLIGA